MTCCEKCWTQAQANAVVFQTSVTDEYVKLLNSRKKPCTPEEQCGDVHICVSWFDEALARCRCGRFMLDTHGNKVDLGAL